jgi:hypothetical protein
LAKVTADGEVLAADYNDFARINGMFKAEKIQKFISTATY